MEKGGGGGGGGGLGHAPPELEKLINFFFNALILIQKHSGGTSSQF